MLNRWRVRAGIRSIDPAAPSSRLVFSGGPNEAGLMARYALEERGFTGDVIVEEAERIKVVSNPLHALKARLYLRLQRPDLAARMVRSADYRVGEWAPLEPLLALYGLRDLAKTRKSLAAKGLL